MESSDGAKLAAWIAEHPGTRLVWTRGNRESHPRWWLIDRNGKWFSPVAAACHQAPEGDGRDGSSP